MASGGKGGPVRVIVAAAIALAIAGCESFTKNGDAQRSISSYFDAQKEYAAGLQKAIGEDKDFRILPVMLAAYARGSVLKPGSPDLVTSECREGAAKLKFEEDPVVQFPTVTRNRTFSIGGGISKDVLNVFKRAIELGAKVSDGTTFSLGYQGDKQQLIPSGDAKRFLRENTACAKAIAGQRVLFVRGHITAKMEIASESTTGLSATAKVQPLGDFTVAWDDKGGFKVTDSKAVPRFMIVSELALKETTDDGSSSILTLPGGGGKAYVAVVKRPSEDLLARLPR